MTDLEHDIKVIPIDANFQSEVEKLHKAGWELVSGVVPVAIYHLVRVKGKVDAVGGFGTMQIDDAGVFIIPAKKDIQ